MKFPKIRMRRLRENSVLRDMVRETRLSADDFIMPLFVVEGLEKKEPIVSMPGQYRFNIQEVVVECRRLADMGVRSVILFGVPETKDPEGSGAWHPDGIVQKAIREVKKSVPELLVIGDVCLCEYTSHGHCGLIQDHRILNDPTLDLLAKTALSQVQAGADMVAPSDMMDGRIASIRDILDKHDFDHIPIMSYAAKYSSAFYGPFRDAAGSAPAFGDRRSYQMDPPNRREAIREMALDVEEGADIIMVKPALAYLDIIHEARSRFHLPVAAYQVSGEYAMIKAAAANGWLDEKRIVLESLTAIKRAGAHIILSYFTPEAVRWLT